MYQHPSHKHTLDSEQFRQYIAAFSRLLCTRSITQSIDTTGKYLLSVLSQCLFPCNSHVQHMSLSHKSSTTSTSPVIDEQSEISSPSSTESTRKTLVELLSYANIGHLKGLIYLFIYSAFVTQRSMWICG